MNRGGGEARREEGMTTAISPQPRIPTRSVSEWESGISTRFPPEFFPGFPGPTLTRRVSI